MANLHQLLKAMGERINYVGPVEGYDVFGDACDVVVTDGFTGNVLVKTIEGLVYMVRDLVGSKVKRNPVYIASGVAIVANSWWTAQQARAKLKIVWNEGPTAANSTKGFDAQAQAYFKQEPQSVTRTDGDVAGALKSAVDAL